MPTDRRALRSVVPRAVISRCRICGSHSRMSREHVIPRAVGNDRPTRVITLNSLAMGFRTGERHQSGLARHSVCGHCNSFCGTHYVNAFARWTTQAARYHQRIKAGSHVFLPFTIDSLAVAKQLGAMTLAMAFPESVDLPHYRALRRFVALPELSAPVDSFRFFTYFHFGAPVFDGCYIAMNVVKGGPAPVIHCNVGLEPLGYVVTGDDAASVAWANAQGLCDLSRFCVCPPRVLRVEHLMLPARIGRLHLAAEPWFPMLATDPGARTSD
jgi:hypothetical protein